MVWEVKKIEELSKRKDAIVSGPFGSNLKVEHYKNKGIPIIRLQNIGKGYFINKDIKYISEEKAEELKYHSFISGDVVLAKLGIPIGKACKVPDDLKRGIIVADVVRIRLDKNIIDYDFLEYYLNTNLSISQLTKNVSGATRPRVNLSDVRNIVIDLPPISIQKHIVAILDEAFEKISKAKENAEKNLRNAKEIFESYLQSVFENKGEGWVRGKLSSFVMDFIVPQRDKPKEFSGDIPWCRIEDFNGVYLSDSKSKQCVCERIVKEMGLKVYPINTVIVSCSAYLGRCAIIRKPLVTNQTFIGLVPSNKVNSLFLYYYMISMATKLNGLASGATIKYLSKKKFQELEVYIPSVSIQKVIVTKLNSLSQETKRLEAIYNQKLQDLEELKKSILQKAFNGELTEC